MINLVKYYIDHIESDGYYNGKFGLNIINDINDSEIVDVFDAKDAFSLLKDLSEPYNEEDKSKNALFILVCFYLHHNGYSISIFPDALSRPVSRYNFSYKEIRNQVIREKPGFACAVPWDARRSLIGELKLIQRDNTASLHNSAKDLIRSISTGDRLFAEMSQDEKLENISNSIEYLLKKNNKFKSIDKNSSFGLIGNDEVKAYRNVLNCFRHAHEDALKERSKYSIQQKDYLINYGITIINALDSKTIKAD